MRTVSKAFEKSRAITRTKRLVESMMDRLWRREIKADVVEPDGLKAY